MPSYYECGKVDPENSWSVGIECKVTKDGGLYERTALNTFSIFHSHFQTIAADKASGCLEQRRDKAAFIGGEMNA